MHCWQLFFLRMADRNLPLAAAMHHLIIEEAGVLDSDFILFLWLIAVTFSKTVRVTPIVYHERKSIRKVNFR